MAFLNKTPTTTSTIYEVNPKESGVFLGAQPYGFIHLFMDNDNFLKEYPEAVLGDILFSNPRETKQGNSMLTVLLNTLNGIKVVGTYFPHKSLTLEDVKHNKSDLSYTLWTGSRDATEADLVDMF